MPPRSFKSFQRLSARLQRHFGGDNLIWFPATEGATEYTVPIDCRQASDHGATSDLAGVLKLDAGTITLHAAKDLFPFVPDENMIFMFGPSDGAETPAYTSAAIRYEITAVDGPEQFSDYTLTARRHA